MAFVKKNKTNYYEYAELQVLLKKIIFDTISCHQTRRKEMYLQIQVATLKINRYLYCTVITFCVPLLVGENKTFHNVDVCPVEDINTNSF